MTATDVRPVFMQPQNTGSALHYGTDVYEEMRAYALSRFMHR